MDDALKDNDKRHNDDFGSFSIPFSPAEYKKVEQIRGAEAGGGGEVNEGDKTPSARISFCHFITFFHSFRPFVIFISQFNVTTVFNDFFSSFSFNFWSLSLSYFLIKKTFFILFS